MVALSSSYIVLGLILKEMCIFWDFFEIFDREYDFAVVLLVQKMFILVVRVDMSEPQ